MGKSREGGAPRRAAKSFQLGQRVNVLSTNKRKPLEIKGRGATVVGLPGNGWIFVALAEDKGPPLRIQQRYLVHERTEAQTRKELGSGGGNSSSASPADRVDGPRPIKLRIIGEIGEAIASSKAATPRKSHGTPSSPGRKTDVSCQAAASSVKVSDTPASVAPHHLKEVLRKVRNDVLDAESHIPWSAVRSFWRNRRSKWRAATKAAEGVSDMAGRLSDLRNALVAETATFPACGSEWQAGMDACIAATGTHAQLLGVWEELRGGIGAWLAARSRPSSHLHLASQQAVAARVVAAMARWQAAAGDDEEAQEDFMGQVPVEAICDHRPDNLAAARTLIEKERKVNARQEARLNVTTAASSLVLAGSAHVAVSTSSASGPAPLSPQGIIDGHLAVALGDNFDSGAETEAGSDVTVFSDSWSNGYDSG